MFGEDTLFEKQIRDFETAEADQDTGGGLKRYVVTVHADDIVAVVLAEDEDAAVDKYYDDDIEEWLVPVSQSDFTAELESEVVEKKEEVNEQGGEVVGPIEIEPEEFDAVANTLDKFSDISPELERLEGKGNVTAIVTDGKRYIGIDPQGSDYARYKTEVVDSEEEVMRLVQDEGNWLRKHTAGV